MNFIIEEKGYDAGKIMLNGTRLFLGNGYMGLRGTLEEFTKKELAGCTLAGVYDQVGDLWREPVNAPIGQYTRLYVDGKPVNALDCAPDEHAMTLDLEHAALSRKSTFGDVTIASERFVSRSRLHLIATKYSVTVGHDADVRIETGIDANIWDMNGPHLPEVETGFQEGAIYVKGNTVELKHEVATAEALAADFDYEQTLDTSRDRMILRNLTFRAEAGKTYTIYKYVAIFSSVDGDITPFEEATHEAAKCVKFGYDKLFADHAASWAEVWKNADVTIKGDDEAQLALRYNIYIMYSNAPSHTDKVAIPARGLAAQVYKGAMFWDTEVYMMPLFNYTCPSLARNMAYYRVNTLDGAREKAREYNYDGAFYAWECQELGTDACTDFAVIDIFTGRPLRTHFRDQQIHISADVAYGIWEHYIATGDDSILLDGGAEAILECARFFYSYAYFKKSKNRYELLEVTCADEYHERVHNNFYTNVMAKYNLEMATKVLDLLEQKYPEKYKELMDKLDYAKVVPQIREMAELLYVPQPDENGIIEQFDGYNKLECPTVAELKSRIIDPREHLGAPVGLMTETQIIKQADVVLGMLLFSDRYSVELRRKNWVHYEPRTEHGSTLSTAIYAVMAAQVGFTDWAYKFFMRTATIDLTGNYRLWVGDLFIGGLHTAANGGTWIAAVQGFGGFKFDGEKIMLNPNLPDKWEELSYKVICAGNRYTVTIRKDTVTVEADAENKGVCAFEINGKVVALENGKLTASYTAPQA